MKVFLIGFMGCGKSTKAKQLATKMNCEVIDLDAIIVERAGISIAEYFSKFGEDEFRKLEADILRGYPYPDTCIVATGGGLPCYLDNMSWMNSHGKTIYLKMAPEALVSRLHNRQKRPLIAHMDDQQLLTFIVNKLKDREIFYEKANLIINAFDLDAEELQNTIERSYWS